MRYLAAVMAILFVAAGGFAFVMMAAVLVAKGVKDERKNGTFCTTRRPTLAAWLARRIVGGYVDSGRTAHCEDLDEDTVGPPGR